MIIRKPPQDVVVFLTTLSPKFDPLGKAKSSLDTIRGKKSVKSDDVVAGLENLTYHGIMHKQIAFDKKSHDLLEGRYSQPQVQWQAGGKQVIVFPEEFKTGEYIKPPWWNK